MPPTPLAHAASFAAVAAITFLAGIAQPCVARAPVATQAVLSLPHSTGGVPTLATDASGTSALACLAFAANESAHLFAVRVCSDSGGVSTVGSLDLDATAHGSAWYSFVGQPTGEAPAVFIGTSLSFLLKVAVTPTRSNGANGAAADTVSMRLVSALNVSDAIAPGWMGGFAAPPPNGSARYPACDVALLTGKNELVPIALGGAMKVGTEAVATQGLPLGGASSTDGATVVASLQKGARATGSGGLQVLTYASGSHHDAKPATSAYLPLAGQAGVPDTTWPFGVSVAPRSDATAGGSSNAAVFTSAAVLGVDLASGRVTDVHAAPAGTAYAELACVSADGRAIAVAAVPPNGDIDGDGDGQWDVFPVFASGSAHTLGEPTTVAGAPQGARHSCGFVHGSASSPPARGGDAGVAGEGVSIAVGGTVAGVATVALVDVTPHQLHKLQ